MDAGRAVLDAYLAGRLTDDDLSIDRRRIAKDEIGDAEVSTVRLPFVHIGGAYETMVFGGPLDQEQWRYETEEQARAGHAVAVEMVKAAAAS